MIMTLPQKLYLLGYSPDKEKFEVDNLQFRGQRLRAGALAELVSDQALAVRPGKRPGAVRLGDAPPKDAFLAEVWKETSPEEPRSWLDLIQPSAHRAESSVREQLAAAGEIGIPEIKGLKKLSLLAQHEVPVHHPDHVTALREEVREPVLQDADPLTLPPLALALTVISAESDRHHLFSRDERHAHEATIEAVRERFDAVFPGLRDALRTSMNALRPSGGGWGQ
ncbi:Golgi phosphoprotein 3 GPP34 [Kitasatospora sp. SolWspMP-SS2h]|uniref:GOLPH3/VPS74 family protein n=1 Tax=Kitasatospora sp. SolWspMP-SS2h TaxID=1305729 RepID=UPI000DB90570|nr:GPP34 family phosphoprotein [Kitasatospora sp. SolWspMP-SS2h]RAJ39981.1 Golgi phosphoprotein 3 GPP34 [Kitasatospora sp. SolWspMP-SS2h]